MARRRPAPDPRYRVAKEYVLEDFYIKIQGDSREETCMLAYNMPDSWTIDVTWCNNGCFNCKFNKLVISDVSYKIYFLDDAVLDED